MICPIVDQVTPGSPGERAGFRPGDVVSEFDGKTVETVKEVLRTLVLSLTSFA